MEYIKDNENIQNKYDDEINKLTCELSKINQIKFEAQSLLEIEKDRYNNLNEYTEEIKSK
jgi:hypothetical protein